MEVSIIPMSYTKKAILHHRNIYEYQYVAIFDTDEIVAPKQDPDIQMMLTRVGVSDLKRKYSSYYFSAVYFPNLSKLNTM